MPSLISCCSASGVVLLTLCSVVVVAGLHACCPVPMRTLCSDSVLISDSLASNAEIGSPVSGSCVSMPLGLTTASGPEKEPRDRLGERDRVSCTEDWGLAAAACAASLLLPLRGLLLEVADGWTRLPGCPPALSAVRAASSASERTGEWRLRGLLSGPGRCAAGGFTILRGTRDAWGSMVWTCGWAGQGACVGRERICDAGMSDSIASALHGPYAAVDMAWKQGICMGSTLVTYLGWCVQHAAC